jgi:hypothetical protein
LKGCNVERHSLLTIHHSQQSLGKDKKTAAL